MPVSKRDIYLFDLRGFLKLEGALSPEEVAELNGTIDTIPRLKPGEWYGYVHGHDYGTTDGLNYQQIYEAGAPFEKLIDHPSWFDHLKTFVGGEDTFDYKHGPLFIDENFVNFREPGEAIGLHSGNHFGIKRNQFRVYNGKFLCCQVNVLIALTDIGPGDGGTMIIPGSHKQNFAPPEFDLHRMQEGGSVDGLEYAEEVYMNAGDALVFVDACCHGSAKRVNEGTRRICVYRYGPSWGNFRHGYEPSPELLDRLTPDRRQIVQPQNRLPREPQVSPSSANIGQLMTILALFGTF
ncbi:MAG: hypothetical protein CME26_13715 [Gemmatimonadetes bacterium]|nr:hypothetical protein [Gemmatimonadota bacterium]|tara:strand:- start:201 stop:1082 length:882 start_codon:yes stop_codon:yes gene_type:complete